MTEYELKNIVGGASWGFWTIAGSVISFVMGLFEGLINPMKCGS